MIEPKREAAAISGSWWSGLWSPARCAKVAISHLYRDHPLLPSFPGLGVVLPSKVSYETTAEINS